MEIQIVEMENTKAKFILKNASPALANALRRTLIQDIPKMAIDRVEFHLGPIMKDDEKEYESETALFDEILAHRLGLVPVPTNYDLFVPQDECSCGGEGCPNCTIMYSLSKNGPCTVMSGDMVPLGDQSLKVKDEFIPIVELTDSQAVLIYAIAVMGTAKQHVKWQAAFGVGYSYIPKVTINPDFAKREDVLEASKNYPGLFKVEGGKLVVDNELRACTLGKAVQEDKALSKAVTVEWDDTSFLFKYDTDGSLTARQVLDKAVSILKEKAEAFSKNIDELDIPEPVPPEEYVPPAPPPEEAEFDDLGRPIVRDKEKDTEEEPESERDSGPMW